MLRRASLLVCSLLLLLIQPARAQSAVSVSLNGAYGFIPSAATVEDAIQNAHARCTERGGTNCWTLVWTASKGFAAIATSTEEDGDVVVGAALGADTPERAAEEARASCLQRGGTSCVVAHEWHDTVG